MIACFVFDPISGAYLPANKVAITLAAQLSKMRLSNLDLLEIKARGIRVSTPNGESINMEEIA